MGPHRTSAATIIKFQQLSRRLTLRYQNPPNEKRFRSSRSLKVFKMDKTKIPEQGLGIKQGEF